MKSRIVGSGKKAVLVNIVFIYIKLYMENQSSRYANDVKAQFIQL